MFEIVLENLVIRKNRLSCDVFGTVFVRSEDFCFPNKNWTDFASTIVFWWDNEFRKINEQGLSQCELTFMDGDYSIEVINDHEVVNLRFLSGETTKFFLLNIDKKLVEKEIAKAYSRISTMIETDS